MNYGIFEKLLSYYGVAILVIATVITVIELLIERLTKGKFPKTVNLLSVFSGIVTGIIYDVVCIQSKFSLRAEGVTCGVVISSLSVIIKVIIGKLKRGESIPCDVKTLLIEGLINGFVDSEKELSVAEKLSKLFVDYDNEDSLFSRVLETLKDNCNISESELTPTTELIINSVNCLEKERKLSDNA